MAITISYSNSVNRTAEALAEQAAADRRLFEAMRQAEQEKFDARPEWQPEYDISDNAEWIRRGGAGGAF